MEVAEGVEAKFSLEELPIGYRFLPTDEELVRYYLINRALYRPLPAEFIPDIRETEFYSSPPYKLAMSPRRERQWFFFIHGDPRRTIRIVGNGIGFWKLSGEKDPIYNPGDDKNISAFKCQFTYFSGSPLAPRAAKKTHWRMEEYRLRIGCHMKNDMKEEELVLGRIKRSKDYDSGF